uniref:Lymphoid-restricted membrane protein n=1 Tax=Esox lucius TaxID=8010 RepID=A0A3P9ADY1_ESOLU
MDVGVTNRQRHNPVDSICRKLQTIQRQDHKTNPTSPFQIPKFTSSSYNSPQYSLRRNLEPILKKREVEEMLTPKGSPQLSRSSHCPTPRLTPFTPAMNTPNHVSTTFTVTSTLGERRGVGVGMGVEGQGKGWQRTCSTPAFQTGESYFSFSRGSQFTQPEAGTEAGSERHRASSLFHMHSPGRGITSYNVNFCPSDSTADLLECELPYPALVVKRLSLGDGAMFSPENRKETLAEVSLICEEDLLDTIFHACDTQRRGKVYVSCIVDYLRHTTSRGSEDSGLEELCNMLDPERKDVSIDLDTYHAIMKEWIDDCRNNGDDTPEELTQESVKLRDGLSAKRSVLLNMTSGSLEAFGGEVSRADLETSDLVYCVADLQFSNQKLQEEVRKLKQTVETLDENNQKLAEENTELKSQARISQQLAQKEKMLKEEVDEMKMTLSCTEEGRARASAQNKQMISMEMDDLQKRMIKLCDLNAGLQVGARMSCARKVNASASVFTLCSLKWGDFCVLFFLFLILSHSLCVPGSEGISLSVAYRLNENTSGSLQTELALAQTPMEGVLSVPSLSFSSPLDETLDREVLLLLQGPAPEQMSLEFKSLINQMKRDFKDDHVSILSTLRGLLDYSAGPEASDHPKVQCELDQRRTDWALSLERLDHYTDSLEKELVKMASNLRRSRTELVHLSVRVQEQENQKQQLQEELEQLKTPGDSREARCQTPNQEPQVGGGDLMGSRALSDHFLQRCSFWNLLSSQRTHCSHCVFPYCSLSPNEKEIETEFQRLSLGFKCDMFTLEKRLRLEERSRDLAEENVRREVSSCQGLLQALTPLCEDDNQSMEIIQRLQKNLDILIQSMARVSSRSEMLGAIHQESRIGKAVEIMIQHVENLRRMYTKEHAELTELRETVMQNERSFGSLSGGAHSDDFRVKTPSGGSYYKPPSRRVSIAAIPRCAGSGPTHFDISNKVQDSMETDVERLTRRSPCVTGKNTMRPPLKRFVSSGAWVETDDPSLMMMGLVEQTAAAQCLGYPPRPVAVSSVSRGLWLWLALVVVLAGLLALLASLLLQPVVDAAPVGTGDSWVTIQQFLWPYTGLRHNGQPPV